MLTFTCLIVLVAGALATQSEDDFLSKSISMSDERIVGGTGAGWGQFPFQVSVQTGRIHVCGGAIIGPRFVLTAAHCTQKKLSIPSNVDVVVDALFLSEADTRYALDKIVNHPKYKQRVMANDIAVLRTKHNIKFTSSVQAVSLPTSDVPEFGNVPATISGWGQNKPGSTEHPPRLQWLDTVTLNREECVKDLGPSGGKVHSNTLCTFNQRKVGICSGDAGSPLTTRDSPKTLIGVASWYPTNCAQALPDVYARVYPHLQFIRGVMNV